METIQSVSHLISAIAAKVKSHTGRTDNPHKVTKAQIGLGKCDNTADADKSVKYAASVKWSGITDRPAFTWGDLINK